MELLLTDPFVCKLLCSMTPVTATPIKTKTARPTIGARGPLFLSFAGRDGSVMKSIVN
jgi:hypothetical protein